MSEIHYCKQCRRLLSSEHFYSGNKSTCRACKVARIRQARQADPSATAQARRTERARGRLRAELSLFILRRLLPGTDEVWRALDQDLADRLDRDAYLEAIPAVDDARRSWSQLFTSAVHLAEDHLGLDPGSGMDVLARILQKQRASRP